MRNALSLPVALVLCILAAPAGAADEVRSLTESLPIEGITRLNLNVPVGKVFVEGTEGASVEVTMSVVCVRGGSRCQKQAEQVALKSERDGAVLQLGIQGLAKGTPTGVEVRLRLAVPRGLDQEIGLGVGDVHVEDVAGNLEIDVGVGNVELEARRQEIRRVKLDSGVGKARLRTDLGEIVGSGMVGSSLTWSQGEGTASIEVDTGVGEIGVELR